MVISKLRLVLKPGVSGSDVESFAWENDWNLFEMGEEDAGALVDIWRTDDGETEIHYVDDRPIGVTYLTLSGGAVDAMERQICDGLDVWSFPEALEELSGAFHATEKRIALFVAALAAPEEESEVAAQKISSVAEDSDPELRRAFVEAAGYLPWPILIGKIEELRENDPDRLVKETAGILMEGIRHHGTD